MTASPLELTWLGQAGFILRGRSRTIVIDPYLSDSLATKYRDTLFEHERAFPPPVDPTTLQCDLVVCTHRHTDHMDGETLRALTAANHGLRVCVPTASRDHALGLGLGDDTLIEMSAGTELVPFDDVRITPIPAAHEELTTDDDGEHLFLGVIVTIGSTTVYHSGDCVPYDGQIDLLRRAQIDAALLPVNGRDAYRRRNGVPGNFWIDEAFEVCSLAGIPTLIGHHFGLFDFNTVDPSHLDRAASRFSAGISWIRPKVGEPFETVSHRHTE